MASRSPLALRERISVFAGIARLPPSDNVSCQRFRAGVAVYASRCDIGIALVNQAPQLLDLRLVLLQELQAGAHDLVGVAVGALCELPLDDDIGLGAGCVGLAHEFILPQNFRVPPP